MTAATTKPNASPSKQDSKPVPTLLSAADAMLYAAEQLEKQSADLDLLDTLSNVFLKSGALKSERPPDIEEHIRHLKIRASGIVDLKLQQAAMHSAARTIRAMANETKLVEARAAAKGIGA